MDQSGGFAAGFLSSSSSLLIEVVVGIHVLFFGVLHMHNSNLEADCDPAGLNGTHFSQASVIGPRLLELSLTRTGTRRLLVFPGALSG